MKGLLLDLHADLTDHRGCHPKLSLKLVTENLETNGTEKSEYFADTPPRKPHSQASRTNDRSQSFKSEYTDWKKGIISLFQGRRWTKAEREVMELVQKNMTTLEVRIK